mmetsp:Transcript_80/g.218  ORF Transcript_80/g.218 Transcript_80/m.218 type:complete len:82 (+) Transcript_80:120-365(+)
MRPTYVPYHYMQKPDVSLSIDSSLTSAKAAKAEPFFSGLQQASPTPANTTPQHQCNKREHSLNALASNFSKQCLPPPPPTL